MKRNREQKTSLSIAGVEVSEAQKFCRTRVGRKLTNEEFLKLYPQQCNAFKEIFKTEYNNLIKK